MTLHVIRCDCHEKCGTKAWVEDGILSIDAYDSGRARIELSIESAATLARELIKFIVKKAAQ